MWEENDPVTGANWKYFDQSVAEAGLEFEPVFIVEDLNSCRVTWFDAE